MLVRVHIHMVDGAGSLEGLDLRPGLADIEPAAEHQQEVGLGDGHVRPPVAVGADQPHPLRVILGQGIHRHQGVGDGNLQPVREGLEQAGGSRGPDAAPGQDHGSFRGPQVGQQVA